jgi:hypothetical protein
VGDTLAADLVQGGEVAPSPPAWSGSEVGSCMEEREGVCKRDRDASKAKKSRDR